MHDHRICILLNMDTFMEPELALALLVAVPTANCTLIKNSNVKKTDTWLQGEVAHCTGHSTVLHDLLPLPAGLVSLHVESGRTPYTPSAISSLQTISRICTPPAHVLVQDVRPMCHL